jgi:hypothetical protein
MVVAGKLVGEAPVLGVTDTSNLDSLGLPSCTPKLTNEEYSDESPNSQHNLMHRTGG